MLSGDPFIMSSGLNIKYVKYLHGSKPGPDTYRTGVNESAFEFVFVSFEDGSGTGEWELPSRACSAPTTPPMIAAVTRRANAKPNSSQKRRRLRPHIFRSGGTGGGEPVVSFIPPGGKPCCDTPFCGTAGEMGLNPAPR